MKAFLLIVLTILLLVSILTGCKVFFSYDEEDYIGRTEDQIIARYGEFDRFTKWESTGHYRSGIYIIKPKRVGYLGTYNEEHFLIQFDENGVVTGCEYVVTGAGG